MAKLYRAPKSCASSARKATLQARPRLFGRFRKGHTLKFATFSNAQVTAKI
jgi:hypothetical protein